MTTPRLFLLFNHTLTSRQEAEARASLGVGGIVYPPKEIQALWSRVPPEISDISEYLKPVMQWLEGQAVIGDFVLIQGDFGATVLAVGFAFAKKLIPVYSTTTREAIEEQLPDGTVKLVHHFRHQRFRYYGRFGE